MEWLTEEALKCPGCGLPRDETMRHEDDVASYEAHALRCFACSVRDLAIQDAVEANRGRPLPGWHWSVTERQNGSG